MDISKVSLLVITLSFVIFCNATRRRLSGNHITDRSGESSPINSNCFCLPNVENGQHVPDLINAEASSLERLVVYFYIDAKTQQITAYTPNIEKQQIFPDISFTDGDDLALLHSNENINSIILSLNKVSGNAIAGVDSANDVNIDVNVPNSNTNIPSQINVGETDSIETPNYVQTIKENDVQNILSPVKDAAVHINSNGNVEVIDNVNIDTNANILHNLIPVQDSVTELQDVNSTPVSDVSGGWQTNAFNNIYEWSDGKINDIYNQPIKSPNNIEGASFLKFDRWFQQQMDSVINKHAHSVKYPDDAVLKSLVYKNLFQNGIFIMDDGILKTPEGHAVNFSNLKLQPIVAGLSVGYNYPMSGVHSKIVRPYYDAMALSMDHPQKILGIIPIGPDYSPDPIGYTTMHVKKVIPGVMSSTVLKTHCSNTKCYTIPDISFRSGKQKKSKTILKDTQADRTAQDTGNQEVHMKIYHTAKPLSLIDVKHLEHSRSQKNPNSIPVLNNILSNIYKLLLSEESSRGADKKTPKYEVRPIAEDGPDFRIVGGSAATGSGTPVSSRGRSASD